MANTYPSSVRFILAEDVREETGKKLSILGCFAGDDVEAGGQSLPKTLPSLAFITIFRGGEGKFKVSAPRLISPSGKEVLSPVREGEATVKKGTNLVTIFKWMNITLPELGEYTFKFSLDDKPYDYTFELKHGKASSTLVE